MCPIRNAMEHQIFIVEDHPVLRSVYADVLRFEPGLHLSGQASSAEEALVVLESVPCDLLVTDLMLPGMSGVDLVMRLRSVRPSLPAMVISGHEESVYAERARAAGAVAFLPKSTLARTLVETIREVLSRPGADGPP